VTNGPVTLGDRWAPFTCRKLAETGVGVGWRCLEIGAGIGPVTAWLVDRVGNRGQVVAVDIGAHRLQVRHHGAVAGSRQGSGYHLIHARLVFEHVPQRHTVATSFVAALRPGGWLVVEDYDLPTLAFHGGRLVSLLQGTGLVDVAAEGFDEGDGPGSDSAPVLVCARGRRPTTRPTSADQGATARGR
jgi:SAM-dependent methyltransferase